MTKALRNAALAGWMISGAWGTMGQAKASDAASAGGNIMVVSISALSSGRAYAIPDPESHGLTGQDDSRPAAGARCWAATYLVTRARPSSSDVA